MALDIVSYAMGKKKGGVQPTGEIEITQNGITNVSGYATANVDVAPVLQKKSLTINSNTTTKIEPDSNYAGLEEVNITTNVPQPSGKIEITENGTDIDVSSYATADVNVSGGGEPGEYFNDTLSNVENYYIPRWQSLIRKFYEPVKPNGNNMNYAFLNWFLPIQPPKVINTSNVTSMYGMYSLHDKNSAQLTTIDAIKTLDVSNNGNFSSMFYNFASLTNLDFSNWVIKPASTFNQMFMGCTNLTSLDLSCIGEVSGLYGTAGFSNMFNDCANLTSVDLKNATPTQNNAQTGSMFNGCKKLTTIDMSNFDFTKITSHQSMFGNDGTANTGPANNCLIYVKDQTQVNWFTTNYPRFTNVQIKS